MSEYFEPIGYRHKKGFIEYIFRRGDFYPRLVGEIIFTRLGKANRDVRLFHLAPLDYWETHYPGKRCRVDYLSAINDLKEECMAKGLLGEEIEKEHIAWRANYKWD